MNLIEFFSHFFTGKFFDHSIPLPVPCFFLSFVFASLQSNCERSSCIWLTHRLVLCIFLLWSPSHSYCSAAGTLLYCNAYTKPFICSKVKRSIFKVATISWFNLLCRIVMIVALSYLSCIHLHRQFNSCGNYSLDITGPLMIITQKVTSLAFSIHDGFVRDTKVRRKLVCRELIKSNLFLGTFKQSKISYDREHPISLGVLFVCFKLSKFTSRTSGILSRLY